MTDKVQKIREEVEKRFEQIKNSKRESDSGAFYQLKELLEFIDSLQEEPVSEDLEETAKLHVIETRGENVVWDENARCAMLDFKAGAKWQKEQDKETIELAEDMLCLLVWKK